ncbi:MAG TPA: hypothetical protein VME45_22510 [Stellaceae bacterium]|nr:hypothetical protein [Stellaceae bacterium]
MGGYQPGVVSTCYKIGLFRTDIRCFEYNEIPLVGSKQSVYRKRPINETNGTRGKVVTASIMDHDDDVEHLFSWLQTPELRYREFAGAREITDSVVTLQQQRADNAQVPQDEPVAAPRQNTQLKEEYPPDQFPDQAETRVVMVPEARPATHESDRVVVREEPQVPAPEETARAVVREEASPEQHEDAGGAGRGPAIIAPVPMAPAPEQAGAAGPFALDAGGRRSLHTGPVDEAGQRPPFISAPPPPAASPMPAAPLPAAPSPTPAPQMPSSESAPAPTGGLLGGAYRDDDQKVGPVATEAPPPASEGQERNERSLDAVFGRLSGGRSRLPDPRERARHSPGLTPPAGRSR